MNLSEIEYTLTNVGLIVGGSSGINFVLSYLKVDKIKQLKPIMRIIKVLAIDSIIFIDAFDNEKDTELVKELKNIKVEDKTLESPPTPSIQPHP